MTSPATMQVKDLRVRVSSTSTEIIKGVSFDLQPGRVFALVGESGSGKSVTSLAAMRLLPDALTITGGSVMVGEQDLFALPEADMQSVRGERVAMIFQNAMTALNPVQKVGEQVAETLQLHTTKRGEGLHRRVMQLFAEVGVQNPQSRYHFYPHQLSGGQQQRVMIAMALACEPDVLIADEPTTALDVTIQEQVLALIKGLTQARQLAVLLITHDMGVVSSIADEVGVMYAGEIIERAPVATFFQHPREEYSRRLIDALPDLQNFQAEKYRAPLLQLQDIKVHFPIKRGVLQRVVDYTRAVDGVSLNIGRAETYVLVGESGSGKSTLGRAILNLETLTSGRILFDGKGLHGLGRSGMQPYRSRLQVIFQNPYSSMNPRMTVADIIREGMDALGIGSSRDEGEEVINTLLQRVQLGAEFGDRYPHELSGGQLQRVSIARALAVEPELIICDEPTSALDVSIRADILGLLKALQDDFEVSYLFITHDFSIVPGIAHQVGVMKEGKLVEQGPAARILTAPENEYTRTLLASVPKL